MLSLDETLNRGEALWSGERVGGMGWARKTPLSPIM